MFELELPFSSKLKKGKKKKELEAKHHQLGARQQNSETLQVLFTTKIENAVLFTEFFCGAKLKWLAPNDGKATVEYSDQQAEDVFRRWKR